MTTFAGAKRSRIFRSIGSLRVLAAVLMLAVLASASAAWAGRATVVGPGDSIQAAVDAASPGDTLLVSGTHRENVAVQTDGLTLRGARAVIIPPATPAVHACFDPTEVGEAVHGICVIGDVDFDTGEVSRIVEGVTVTGFTIRGFTGSALTAIGAANTTFMGNVVSDNGDAGVSAARSTRTHVLSNQVSGSRFGIFAVDALGGDVLGNSVHDNCVGLFAFAGTADFRIAANSIHRNTRACPEAAGEWPALSGAGVLLVGATSNTVSSNLIIGNIATGDTAFSGGVVVATVPDAAPTSGNIVRRNAILANDPDIFWDGAGVGNVFQDNLCRTAVPPGVC
jgi:parallel beta-helix repeat protein